MENIGDSKSIKCDANTLSSSVSEKRQEPNCQQCNVVISKYTCPKCGFKSCSVKCVKEHKVHKSCDGMPKVWKSVSRIADFTPQTSINDQEFLERIKRAVCPIIDPSVLLAKKELEEDLCETQPSSAFDGYELTLKEQTLRKCTKFRRIGLKIDYENEIGESYHENYSDTIFWDIGLRFVHSGDMDSTLSDNFAQLSSEPQSLSTGPTVLQNVQNHESFDGKVANYNNTASGDSLAKTTSDLKECFSFRVANVPETLTVRTLIKQFVKPKLHGPLVSRCDLDVEKLAPFIRAPDSCVVFMELDVGGRSKYMLIDQSRSIVNNLRGYTVFGHPKFIVVLETDASNFEQATQHELELIRAELNSRFDRAFVNHRPQNRFFKNNRRGGFDSNRGRHSFNKTNGTSPSKHWRQQQTFPKARPY